MRALLALVLMSMMASCATIAGGGPYLIPVSSEPPGAVVSQDGYSLGVTPCIVTLPTGASSVVTLTVEGRPPREVDLGSISNAPLVLGSVLLFGPLGLIVDAASGAWARIDTRPAHVDLASEPMAAWERPPRPGTTTSDPLPRLHH